MEQENKHSRILAAAEAYRRGDDISLAALREEEADLYEAALRSVVADPGSAFGARDAAQLRRRAAKELLQVSPTRATFESLRDYPDADVADRAETLIRAEDEMNEEFLKGGIAELEAMLKEEDKEGPAQ